MSAGWWPHARAALIGLHVYAVTLMALPAPGGGMNRKNWSEQTVQDEFAAWAGRLDAVGVHLTSEELQDVTFEFAVRFMSVRDVALKPFQSYYRYCGTVQSWRMFIAPHRYPDRMAIDVLEGGAWRPVYVERSSTATWRGHQFDNDRMRSLIFRMSWKSYRKMYEKFADWVALRAAEDFPAAEQVRVRFAKRRTPTPEEVRSGNQPVPTWHLPQVRDLRRVRAAR